MDEWGRKIILVIQLANDACASNFVQASCKEVPVLSIVFVRKANKFFPGKFHA